MEARLSLGQVALRDLSRTAIYFVETGKAKPSIETLQLIAERTNKPLDYFLLDPSSVSHEAALIALDRLVSTGDHEAALAAGEALLAKAPDRRIAGQASMLTAIALIRLGQPGRARSHAVAARIALEEAGDIAAAAEALGWEAASALMTQDPAALGLAQDALARCRRLKPSPPMTEARLLYILGTVHSSRHEHAKSIHAYEESAAVGAAVTDLRQMSFVYGNLSLSYQEIGQFAQAAHYARRAMLLYETLNDRVSIARAENNLAVLLFKQGDIASAMRHAVSALAQNEELGIESGKAHVLMTLAELELTRSDHAAATRHATAALEVAERMGEGANAGEAHVWLARIADSLGDVPRTDEEFGLAFAKFDSVTATEWSARAHAAYAELLEGRGDLSGANRHLRLALAATGGRPAIPQPALSIAIA